MNNSGPQKRKVVSFSDNTYKSPGYRRYLLTERCVGERTSIRIRFNYSVGISFISIVPPFLAYFSIERDAKEGGLLFSWLCILTVFATLPENHYQLIPLTTEKLMLLVNNASLPHYRR